MNYSESAIVFSCSGESLVGILAQPAVANKTGVLIVVGGPQYRVGSHRQFLLLSRALAAQGYPVMRFDYRGMGDSTGDLRGFEHISVDIGAAINSFLESSPGVERVVLWGLCDAASASLLYLDATSDQRVAGLILLNPWVRSEASLAKTHVKHYYGQRLFQADFWKKLLSGHLNIGRALAELSSKIGLATTQVNAKPVAVFQERMERSLKNFNGQVLLILSSNDYTAKEFLEYAAYSEVWCGFLCSGSLTRHDTAGADHTFSSQYWRETVENATVHWLMRYE
ncbi:hydrolase 1, exosortase A system-associated [Ferribacterium limneticum]|uniref:hydrolase 1, exosortase A system-associated n=1 Tax=Ferribacterium limneticum TaxID=76259 RepID=UPI001CF9F116|nr:hydrolase 1, exosortase A system-associated [Ferribacterium limneticum]UCV17306.1 hydrolase 1, exosortase A system-associated [Ferribacterium limneticum]